MPRLKSRDSQIPGGLRFQQSALKWQPPPYSSFETIVRSLIQVRRANMFLTRKNGWSIDYPAVADEVDRYNAAICEANGWSQYIMADSIGAGGGPPNPKSLARSASLSQSAGRVAAGVNVIADMFGKEGPIRDKSVAERRAAICVECPMNDKGDWTRFFTVPAQAMIRKALGVVKDLDLTTSLDEKLQICQVCGCPLKGKVWARLPHILNHISKNDYGQLPPQCWIAQESKPTPIPATGTN